MGRRKHEKRESPEPAAYSPRHASLYIGSSEPYVRSLMRSGQLKYVPVNRRQFILKTTLDTMLENGLESIASLPTQAE